MRILMLVIVTLLVSCKSNPKLEELDLMSNGLPIKIEAPAEAVVKVQDIGGIFKDVTVKSGEEYYIQITSSEALTTNAAERIAEIKSDIQQLSFFGSMVQEDEHGFIFEKKIGDNQSYDFRHLRIQGDNEYLFQTGLLGKFTLEQVEEMYEAVQ